MKKLRTAVTEGLAQGHAIAHCIVTLGVHGLPDPDRMHYIVYHVCMSLHDTSWNQIWQRDLKDHPSFSALFCQNPFPTVASRPTARLVEIFRGSQFGKEIPIQNIKSSTWHLPLDWHRIWLLSCSFSSFKSAFSCSRSATRWKRAGGEMFACDARLRKGSFCGVWTSAGYV